VRTVTLARILQLPIDTLLRLRRLSGVTPFPAGENLTADVVRRTEKFVRLADAVAASRMSLDQVDPDGSSTNPGLSSYW
jgi:hypothetical protein